MFDLVNNESQSREMFLSSFNSIFTLWNSDKNSFIRNSNNDNDFYPTATFHGLSALSECGYNYYTGDSSYLKLNSKKTLSSDNFLAVFKSSYTNSELWIHNILEKSSHTTEENNYDSRVAIVLERLLASLDGFDDVNKIENISTNLMEVEKILRDLCSESSTKESFPEPGISPLPLLNLTLCVKYYNSLIKKLNDQNLSSFDKTIHKKLDDAVQGHLNYHMARFNGNYEPSFDSVSLTIALYAASILSPEIRYTPFFNSCLKVIVENQNSNGCWPSGVSISFSDNGDVVQLPSVEIAMFISEAIVDKNILVNFDKSIDDTLSLALPSLRKFAGYLKMTFQKNIGSNGKEFNGWSSDRIGRKDFVETWITAQTNRFLFKLWLIEKALLRSSSIAKLGLSSFTGQSLSSEDSKNLWSNTIVEPDNTTKPVSVIFEYYITPILEKKSKSFIAKPNKDRTSFIIFGPPGSGKTYFVEQLARCLDWPLIELSPGHFIKNGLELIESTTKEIFDILGSINHAVVLFDECDELFRSRDKDESQTRTILSFATASMLPKLQKLHDKGDIILVLGTNYLHRIDSAVRRPGRFDDIFLFDRPDPESRTQHIRNYFSHKQAEIKETKIETLAARTNFFTIKEIFKSCDEGSPIKDNTLEEYIKWCKNTGVKELKKSRFDEKTKNEVKNRWGINSKK